MSQMDALEDFGFFANVAFPSTADLPGRIYVNDALEVTDWPRSVLEPISPDQYRALESSSEDEDGAIMLGEVNVLNGVNAAGFGPGGEDNEGVRFRVHDHEQATYPAVRKMIIKAPSGPPIIVTPRCQPRKRVTRACVELAISEWMRNQNHLPPNERTHVEVQHVSYPMDGEVKSVAVWLWRGLEQVMGEPNTFTIRLR